MRYRVLLLIVAFLIPQATRAAETTLWDDLIDVTIRHIKTHGPSLDAAQFLSLAHSHAWARRTDIADEVIPYLSADDPGQVAPAIDILFRLRGYRPFNYIGDIRDFETANEAFYARLDKAVFDALDHLHSLRSDSVLKTLALYVVSCKTAEARRELLRIIKSPVAHNAREQALICLAWYSDPADMDLLYRYMLGDRAAGHSLPYQLRTSYGKDAIPYLTKATQEAERMATRLEAAFQLVHMRAPAGFAFLHDVALQDPEPQDKETRALDRIKQFAVDYLEMPRDVSTKQAVAAYISKKQDQLCRSEN